MNVGKRPHFHPSAIKPEGPLGVDLTRAPSHGRTSAYCALRSRPASVANARYPPFCDIPARQYSRDLDQLGCQLKTAMTQKPPDAKQRWRKTQAFAGAA
jgi:hypothetical protein